MTSLVCTLPKGPSRTKFATDSKFTIRSKFTTAIVKHYGGHFETTIFKGKLSSKSLQIVIRGERTWAIAIRPFYANQKFRTEFPYFSRQKRPEFRRKRDLYESLLTALWPKFFPF